MKRLLLGILMCLTVNTQAQEVTQQIGDDGFVEVPLQFTFPYYGQLFTTSWMFDNGVVGFYSPFNGYNGGQNYYSQPFSADMGGQFNYMIAPLWTDLINYSGTFTTEGNSQFQRYNWNNISQWGYPENLNTFSLEIKPSGQISVTYDQVNINSFPPVSIGTTGDVTQNEFQQMFFAQPESITTTANVSNWISFEEPVIDYSELLNDVITAEVVYDTVTELETTAEVQTIEAEEKPVEESVIAEKNTTRPNTISIRNTTNTTTEELVSQNTVSTNLIEETENITQDVENKENVSTDVTTENSEQEILIANILTQNTDTVNVAALNSTNTFNNNMQQVLALGGTITQILNTPVPDFSRFDIKPPTQEEQVQTVKVENTIENMNAEDIESQAELLAGSMDLQAQAIALQLIGYKAGFDQYGGTIQDQQNWYQSTSVYSNNRVPSGSNQLFGAQDQRHQELMSLQYRR